MDGGRPCAATTSREKRQPTRCMPMCDSARIGFQPQIPFFSSSAVAAPRVTAAKLWRLSRRAASPASLPSSSSSLSSSFPCFSCLGIDRNGDIRDKRRDSGRGRGSPGTTSTPSSSLSSSFPCLSCSDLDRNGDIRDKRRDSGRGSTRTASTPPAASSPSSSAGSAREVVRRVARAW
uniref:Uncharacterized protein n=1 Tax=Setaria italica TaxID=4555 RepID=K3XZK8_SETIT